MDMKIPSTPEDQIDQIPIKVLVQYRSEPGIEYGKYIVGLQFGTTMLDLPLQAYTEDSKRVALLWAQEKLKQDLPFRSRVSRNWGAHMEAEEYRQEQERRRAEAVQKYLESQKPLDPDEIEERHQARVKAREKNLKWLKKHGNDWFGEDLDAVIDSYIRHRLVLRGLEEAILKRRKKYTKLTNFYEGGLTRDRIVKLCDTSAAKLKRMSQAADRIEAERKFYDKL